MRSLALARRLMQQLTADKRAMGMIFVAPCLILWLLSVIFNTPDYQPRLVTINVPQMVDKAFSKSGARLRKMDLAAAKKALRRREIDGIIRADLPKGVYVDVEGSNPTVTRSVVLALHRVERALNPLQKLKPDIKVTFIHGGPQMSSFDNFGPVLVGFMVFFFVFLLSGISFVRERTTGTLGRMLATPLRRHEIVLGYALGFSGIVIVQSTIIAVISVYLLEMMLVGSFAWLLVITLLLALSALAIGMLLSAFASSEFQMIQFIPLVIIPQVFFSGLFNMDAMADWLQALGKIFPLTYGADAMREVMIRGSGFAEIALDLGVLLGITVVCLVLKVFVLRRYRRI